MLLQRPSFVTANQLQDALPTRWSPAPHTTNTIVRSNDTIHWTVRWHLQPLGAQDCRSEFCFRCQHAMHIRRILRFPSNQHQFPDRQLLTRGRYIRLSHNLNAQMAIILSLSESNGLPSAISRSESDERYWKRCSCLKSVTNVAWGS